MLDRFFRRCCVLVRLRGSLFAPWLDAYVAYLHGRGHGAFSIRLHVNSVEHFGRWLQSRGTAAQDIDRKTVMAFLRHHVPHCRCTGNGSRQLKNAQAALLHLLRLPCFADKAPPSEADALLAEYDAFLHQVAGLADATRHARRRYVRDFLKGMADGAWCKLQPGAVATFFVRYVRRLQRVTAQRVATVFRSFLRFLRTTGRCDRDLAAAIPSIPQWSMASLPRFLTERQVRIFLRRFDRRTPVGRRDYAMALCMVELGLRVGEVVALRLDDIDWRAGTLRVHGGKNRRSRELPLPQVIGRAIAAYLRHGRPATASRHLFVRQVIRKGLAISTPLVQCVMRRALAKVPGAEQFKGSHVLRHTAATRLFERGVPLKIVADLLGHRSIDSTAIYTKVNVPNLVKVALPWPEVQS